MSAYALTPAARDVLAEISGIGGGARIALHRYASTIACHLGIDCEGNTLSAHLEFGGTVNRMQLQADDTANPHHLAEWIESVANGTLDTALAAPRRMACTCPSGDGSLRHPCPAHPSVEAPCWPADDERTLRKLARNGGSVTLSTGTVVAVHAAHAATARTAVLVHAGHTHLVSGSWRDVYLGLSDLAEQLLAAA
ncbi:hypothetical protein ACGFZ7_16310 [Pseudomonas sp. NPDC047963]|jgi:hypothetical protein|nr:hypothetical protein [Pseudomonas sp.]